MTTPKTTVATREQIAAEVRKTPIGQPNEAAQLMIAERKALNAVAQTIAGLTWGRNLGADVCRAIAEYCRRYETDAATEVDVLGGRIYRNAAYYIRRGTELRREGMIRDVIVDQIAADPRLTRLATATDEVGAAASAEMRRREWLRIKHGVPEEAKGACVVTIVPADGAPVIGCNWAGCGKTTAAGKMADPVGEADPSKTAETRAYRRAWRHLVDTIPALKAHEDEADEEGKAVSEVVREEIKAHAEPVVAALVEPKTITIGEDRPTTVDADGADLSYDDSVARIVPEPNAAVAALVGDADTAWALAYPVPFGTDKGKTLGEVVSPRYLRRIMEWASDQLTRGNGFGAAAELESAAAIVLGLRAGAP
jgi:hypothetical protein